MIVYRLLLDNWYSHGITSWAEVAILCQMTLGRLNNDTSPYSSHASEMLPAQVTISGHEMFRTNRQLTHPNAGCVKHCIGDRSADTDRA